MSREQHERKCPHCNEWISATAPKCFNCGEYVTDDEDDDAEEETAGPRVPFSMGAGVVGELIATAVAIYLLAIK